jgi:hypothetical protein
MTFENDQLVGVERLPIDDQGQADLLIPQLGRNRHAILAVSAITPTTTEPATYQLQPKR